MPATGTMNLCRIISEADGQGDTQVCQETTSQAPQASQQQEALTAAIVTVEVPLAISEERNFILHLVPVEHPLVVDLHPAGDMETQDLPASPAASDETLISGEGPQEDTTQLPGGETEATGPNVGSDCPQEAAVQRGKLIEMDSPPPSNTFSGMSRIAQCGNFQKCVVSLYSLEFLPHIILVGTATHTCPQGIFH
ncbi:hypothetical protein JD844_027491 [Phrynosoma platyrhinos]|uniref:Uncharacterized protein n=1 Tax=Phrynosoma platyrhinos TaxID=52577 RepID=A0ABQ7SGG0_PHRPL|nr:hypothetical protein JD844_027491 [Phrynosoma platyrhinos]